MDFFSYGICSLFARHGSSAAPALSSSAGPLFSAQYNPQALVAAKLRCIFGAAPKQGSAAFQARCARPSRWLDLAVGSQKGLKVLPAGEAGPWQSAALVWRSSTGLLSNSRLQRIQEVLFCTGAPGEPAAAGCAACLLPPGPWLGSPPAGSCPFTRTAALPHSSSGCSSPAALAVQLLSGGENTVTV